LVDFFLEKFNFEANWSLVVRTLVERTLLERTLIDRTLVEHGANWTLVEQRVGYQTIKLHLLTQ
jgi:hypothetical protein